MTKFCTNRNKQTILIESIPYSNWEIEMVRMNIPADNRSFRQELLSFLSEWFSPNGFPSFGEGGVAESRGGRCAYLF